VGDEISSVERTSPPVDHEGREGSPVRGREESLRQVDTLERLEALGNRSEMQTVREQRGKGEEMKPIPTATKCAIRSCGRLVSDRTGEPIHPEHPVSITGYDVCPGCLSRAQERIIQEVEKEKHRWIQDRIDGERRDGR